VRRASTPSKARRFLHWLVLGAGSALLLRMAYWAQGGKARLWAFETMDEHRFTAMAMLTGTLRLRNGVAMLTNDEQAYNGATYTNWGFGVPLLQAPLHALAAHMRSFASGFFPDRAIFFGYVALLLPVLWLALSRAVAPSSTERDGFRRKTWAFAATSLLLTCSLFPLMGSRFWIYEETLGYFIVAQLFALSAYVYAMGSQRRLLPIVLLGAAAGMGLLIRPTGLGYLGIWGLLVLLERRSRGAVLAYVGASLPFVAFWLASNRVRSGSVLSLGYANSTPWYSYHLPVVRFGSLCADTLSHTGIVARAMLRAFFVGMNVAPEAYLDKCHFEFEVRPGSVGGTEAAFGAGVLVVVAWILLHHLARRERRVAIYLPFAGLGLLFGDYVILGGGFAWRYAGDFWPLIALIVVQYIRGLPRAKYRGAFGFRVALVLGVLAYVEFHRNVTPVVEKIETLDAASAALLKDHFAEARWGMDHNLPTRLECGEDVTVHYYRGREGWGPACTVDTFTNVYLGVPEKGERRYELRLDTRGFARPSVRVYVNGRFYTAVRDGETYRAEVDIDYAALKASAVQVTVEWVRGFEVPTGSLAAVELI
jgi:hypothetical protein